MVDFIGECGEAGATPDQIVTELAQHPRWGKISRERIELAIKQLVSSGLIVTVTP
jgi:hypothetical protein